MSARAKAVQGSNQRARAVGIPGLQAGEDVKANQTLKVSIHKKLTVAISFGIAEALELIASGQIEKARNSLEATLRYADAVSPSVSKNVGLYSVRCGKGF